MNGVLTGGWAFVWAAYAVSALLIFGYAARTFLSVRTVFSRSDRPAEAGPHTNRGAR